MRDALSRFKSAPLLIHLLRLAATFFATLALGIFTQPGPEQRPLQTAISFAIIALLLAGGAQILSLRRRSS